MSDFTDMIDEIRESAGPIIKWSVRGVAAASILALGLFSFKDIEPGQAAVRVNNFTGAEEAITQAGWVTRVPMVHSIYMLDAAPQTFTMKGDKSEGPLDVKELTVRASDGSNFHFDDISIIFQLKGDEAMKAVADAGVGHGFKAWMKPFARSILRDEFGKESTIDVSNPTTYAAATQRAKIRLNELLGPHGIEVTQLVTPRPRFNEQYEHAIEERNSLGNEIEVIKSKLERAQTDRARALAVVDQEQNKAVQTKRAELEETLATTVAKQAQQKRKIDTYKIGALGDGQAALSSSTKAAEQLSGELTARYEAKAAEIGAFRTQPVERVMERLATRLKGITIDIQPYANDASPKTINLNQ